MRFWDASALVPLVVEQSYSPKAAAWMKEGSAVFVWWASQVECASAIERLVREGKLSNEGRMQAYSRLERMRGEWEEIDPSPRVRENAMRFLKVHPLKSADALQLAAAFVASEQSPPSLEFVSFDERLCGVASKEGFRVWSE